jgi:hypothetical protein
LLVSMDTSVDSAATSWSARVYNLHFHILGDVLVNSFPRNGSTCDSIFKLTATTSYHIQSS